MQIWDVEPIKKKDEIIKILIFFYCIAIEI